MNLPISSDKVELYPGCVFLQTWYLFLVGSGLVHLPLAINVAHLTVLRILGSLGLPLEHRLDWKFLQYSCLLGAGSGQVCSSSCRSSGIKKTLAVWLFSLCICTLCLCALKNPTMASGTGIDAGPCCLAPSSYTQWEDMGKAQRSASPSLLSVEPWSALGRQPWVINRDKAETMSVPRQMWLLPSSFHVFHRLTTGTRAHTCTHTDGKRFWSFLIGLN